MVESSSFRRPPVQSARASLGTLRAEDPLGLMMGAYHRHTNTISLEPGDLETEQWLSIDLPTGVTFHGTLAINGVVKRSFPETDRRLDLKAWLKPGMTVVTLAGSYAPGRGSMVVSFQNQNITVRQQVGNRGTVHYQLNVQLD